MEANKVIVFYGIRQRNGKYGISAVYEWGKRFLGTERHNMFPYVWLLCLIVSPYIMFVVSRFFFIFFNVIDGLKTL